jgi:hypothetical protein
MELVQKVLADPVRQHSAQRLINLMLSIPHFNMEVEPIERYNKLLSVVREQVSIIVRTGLKIVS